MLKSLSYVHGLKCLIAHKAKGDTGAERLLMLNTELPAMAACGAREYFQQLQADWKRYSKLVGPVPGWSRQSVIEHSQAVGPHSPDEPTMSDALQQWLQTDEGRHITRCIVDRRLQELQAAGKLQAFSLNGAVLAC